MNVDKFGKPITVGCFVLYGARVGDCGALHVGKVLAIETRAGETTFKVRVPAYQWWKDKMRPHVTRLSYPDRMAVVPESVISVEVLRLLEDK